MTPRASSFCDLRDGIRALAGDKHAVIGAGIILPWDTAGWLDFVADPVGWYRDATPEQQERIEQLVDMRRRVAA